MISVRVDAATALRLNTLRATLPDQTWSAVLRWLLTEPRVVEVIRERVGST